MPDHRAEAERWLNEFHNTIGATPPTPRDMLRLAQIHALLAGPPTVTVVKAKGVLTRQQFRDLIAGQPQPKEPT